MSCETQYPSPIPIPAPSPAPAPADPAQDPGQPQASPSPSPAQPNGSQPNLTLLGGSRLSPDSSTSNAGIIVGVAVAAGGTIVLIVAFCIFWNCKRKRAAVHEEEHAGVPQASATSTTADTKRSRARWGAGMDAPQAGAREFFPAGWLPDPTMTLDKSMDLMGMDAKQKASIFADAPTKLPILQLENIKADVDEVCHILAFTHDTPAYAMLNRTMRTPGTGKSLAKLNTFIRGLSNAAKVLPLFKGRVFRGLDVILPETSYREGEPVCWQSFSSATKDIFQTLTFLVMDGNRLSGTLAMINSRNGRQLELISQFPHEQEVLFIENTFFTVVRWLRTNADKCAALPSFAKYDISSLAVLELTEI